MQAKEIHLSNIHLRNHLPLRTKYINNILFDCPILISVKRMTYNPNEKPGCYRKM